MTDWLTVFDQMIYNEVMFSIPDRQKEPEPKSQPLFNQAIFDLFAGGGNDTAIPDLLTSIVNKDEWWVPTNAQTGAFETIRAEAGQFSKMLEMEQPPSNKKKSKKPQRTGSGGTLLPIYDEEPEEIHTTKMNGRELARRVPHNINAMLVCSNDQAEFEIDKEQFNLMKTLADECDLEEWLMKPAPGQLEKLSNATWYAEYPHGDNAKISTRDKVGVVHTRPDRRGLCMNRFVPMTGEQLFRALIDQNAGGALVDMTAIGRKHYEPTRIILSPAILHGFLRGEDKRPGAQPLKAQSIEEINLWLSFSDFPHRNRRFLDASVNGEKLVRVAVPESSKWQALETPKREFDVPGPTLSPVFSLPPGETDSESGFGPDPSCILCPALLAQELGCRSYQLGKHPEKLWKPGRWLILGRLLDSKDIEDSKKRLKIARELQKLIPAGADSIPLSAIQSNKGLSIFHDHPIAFTRAWIEASVRQAEKYTKPFVWG